MVERKQIALKDKKALTLTTLRSYWEFIFAGSTIFLVQGHIRFVMKTVCKRNKSNGIITRQATRGNKIRCSIKIKTNEPEN